MSQSHTLSVGMDVHKESRVVASVAQAHGAEVISLGTIGTRQCDIDKLLQQLRSKRTQLVFFYEADPLRLLALALPDEARICLRGRRPLLAYHRLDARRPSSTATTGLAYLSTIEHGIRACLTVVP